jgi:AcrR family transcriptional regulator
MMANRLNSAGVSEQRDGRRPDKRQAILDGALRRFASDGYTRASIDAIAAEAGVSTRTIYNHFGDKARLFEEVIRTSAEQAAARQIAIIDRHLVKIVDLERDLIDFGREWAWNNRHDTAPHWALIRQVNAEREHIPPAALDAWREAGPRRVEATMTKRLDAIAERGAAAFPDVRRAAIHLLLLLSPDNLRGDAEDADLEVDAMVRSGVGVFLHGYQH